MRLRPHILVLRVGYLKHHRGREQSLHGAAAPLRLTAINRSSAALRFGLIPKKAPDRRVGARVGGVAL